MRNTSWVPATNCFGYAFSRPHWIYAGPYGAQILLGNPPCFVPVTGTDAKYGVRAAGDHASKMTVNLCYYNPYPGQWWLLPKCTRRIEKDGCGPIYVLDKSCSSNDTDVRYVAPYAGGWTLLKDKN